MFQSKIYLVLVPHGNCNLAYTTLVKSSKDTGGRREVAGRKYLSRLKKSSTVDIEKTKTSAVVSQNSDMEHNFYTLPQKTEKTNDKEMKIMRKKRADIGNRK